MLRASSQPNVVLHWRTRAGLEHSSLPSTSDSLTSNPRTRRAVPSQPVVCALLLLRWVRDDEPNAGRVRRSTVYAPSTALPVLRSAFCAALRDPSREGRFSVNDPGAGASAKRYGSSLAPCRVSTLDHPCLFRGADALGVFPSPLSPASPAQGICKASWWNHLAAVAPAHGMLHK